MSNYLSNKKNSKKYNNSTNNSKSLLDLILEYESVVVFGGLGIVVLSTIILTGLFESGPGQRETILFNAAGALLMGVGFIYLIITFMGAKVSFFGAEFDIGMIIYVVIVLFVMIVLGN